MGDFIEFYDVPENPMVFIRSSFTDWKGELYKVPPELCNEIEALQNKYREDLEYLIFLAYKAKTLEK